ncbi:MAG TPA: S9 family peptidase, partial [Vicinamibacteria bacterium]|nr:S9 family peptidase [Vicinamibacteria bacterium]
MISNARAGAALAIAAVVALSSGTASAAPAAVPSPRTPRAYTIEQFMSTTSVNGASFSADESRILFSSNATGVFNVYSVPVAGGTPTALTSSTTDSTFAVSYFRGDDRILFTRDQGGNELNHLYVRGKDGAERDLTPGAKL